jgi:hypothetical protein
MTELSQTEVVAGFMVVQIDREEALWARFRDNLAKAESASAEAAKEPFVKGSTGQLTEHPGFKIAARCDELALRLYRELKWTDSLPDDYEQ